MTEPRIVILTQEVVNQIAAGEVVERPASVVKELVENALDAGARRVDVEIAAGGLELIRVVDDGCGMSPEEAALCLERHATSKLRLAEDLLQLRTMGFRGEALPSIASISRMRLVTRPGDAAAGWAIAIAGGQVSEREPAGCRPGTQVEVRDLFFNTPARKKFLKSTPTETAHVGETLSRLALAAPGVHLTLTQEGRRTLDLPAAGDRLTRARAVLGRRGERLFAATQSEEGIALEGCLGPPGETGRTPQAVFLLVNGRFVRDRALVHAVSSGYGELLDRGRYPVAVLHLDLDPATLDVNVHPQKVEVRFADPSRIYAAVRRCVRDALSRGAWGVPAAASRTYQLRGGGEGYAEHRQRILEATRRFWSASRLASGAGASEALPAYELPGERRQEEGYFSRLRVVGHILGTFIVCEGEDELVLLDGHAAHERVTFEGLRRAASAGPLAAQGLLAPLTLTLEPSLAAAAQEAEEELRQLGFELERFGGPSWTLRAVPALLRHADPEPLLREILEELATAGHSDLLASRRELLLARVACHESVRAGRVLDEQEMRALLASLDEVDFAASCPHGRPVLWRLPRREIESRLGRR